MRRESADEAFLRRQEAILREYNVSTANVTSTGAEVRLTPRLLEYVLGLVEGRTDEDAEALRELLRGPEDGDEGPDDEPPRAPAPDDELAARRTKREETAGQATDPTTYAFWYSSSTPSTSSSS
ncbi:hypothetical protein N7U49_21940 [Streptomyces sp. AD2-2]|nr:hypothetical protein N7U49_21940 [Streptomyces sp. AD2-2]